MLAVRLVHAVGEERPPGGAALRHEHLEVGMPVERARGDELRGAALPAVRGLDVVDHRAAGAAVVHAGRLFGRVRLGADVEAEHHPGLLGRCPHRMPQVVVVRRHVERLPRGHEHDLEPEVGGTVDLGDRVVDVEQRHRRRAHEARRLPLEFDGPVVEHLRALARRASGRGSRTPTWPTTGRSPRPRRPRRRGRPGAASGRWRRARANTSTKPTASASFGFCISSSISSGE